MFRSQLLLRKSLVCQTSVWKVIGLNQEITFGFARNKKGLTKHDRKRPITLEEIDRIVEKDRAQIRKSHRRKGLEPPTYDDHTIEEIHKKLDADANDENLVVFDPETGLMGRRDIIGNDVKQFLKSDKWKEFQDFIELDRKKEEEKMQKLKRVHKRTEEGENKEDEKAGEGEEQKVKKAKPTFAEIAQKKKEQNYEKALKQFAGTGKKNKGETESIEPKEEQEGIVWEQREFKIQELSFKNESNRQELFSPTREEVENESEEKKTLERTDAWKGFEQKPSFNQSKNEMFANIVKEFEVQSFTEQQGREAQFEEDEFAFDLFEEEKRTPEGKEQWFGRKDQETESEMTNGREENQSRPPFYQEVSQERIKRIERKLDRNDRQAERQGDRSFIQSSGMSKENLEKRKALEKFYHFLKKVEPENLVKLLSQTELIKKSPLENIPKFLVLLNFVRKSRVLDQYGKEEATQAIEALLRKIDMLKYSEVAALAVLLDQLGLYNISYWKIMEKRVIQDAPRMSIRCICNIVYPFGRIAANREVNEDFSELFRSLESVITPLIREMKPKDLSQITVGYSKSQNLSSDLFYVIEQTCLEKFAGMQGAEMSTIAHSFVKSGYPSEKFFEAIRKEILNRPDKFKMMELTILMEVFEKYDMLNRDIMKQLERQYLLKGDQGNAQDLAIVFKILTSPSYRMEEKTVYRLRDQCDLLFKNLDAFCLRKMFTNFAEKVEKKTMTPDLIEILIRRLRILKKKDGIKGANLNVIQKELALIKDENVLKKVKRE